jgi:hypothetical protein
MNEELHPIQMMANQVEAEIDVELTKALDVLLGFQNKPIGATLASLMDIAALIIGNRAESLEDCLTHTTAYSSFLMAKTRAVFEHRMETN